MWKKTGNLFITLILSGFFCSNVLAANPEVSVSINQNQILLGDSILLTITINGVDNPQAPELPKMEDFTVKFRGTRQQSFSSFTVVIQGKTMEQKNTGGGYGFDYELTPKKSGELTIPSFMVQTAGKSFQANPIEITVLEQTQRSEDIFVSVEADKTEVYLGEKILVTFNWYVNKNIQGYRVQIPWLEGLKNFIVVDPEIEENKNYQRILVNSDQQVLATKTREFYKGQAYTVISLQRILTPITQGHYTLEPVFVKCDVVTGYQRNSRPSSLFNDFFDSGMDDFFSLGRKAVTEPFSTRSQPLPLLVRDLPQENQPQNYQGAVGNFEFSVEANPLILKVGEPLTLTMKVSGTGNIDQITLPKIPDLAAFKSYEPESKTNITQQSNTLIGDKVFEKVLIPKVKGEYKIPQIEFTFFNPQLKEYQTIKRGPFQIQVAAQEREKEIQVIALSGADQSELRKKDLKILDRDIRYIKTSLGKIKQSEKYIYEKPGVWIIGYLLPLIITGIFLLWQRQKRKLKTNIGFARHRRAFKNAKIQLQKSQKYLAAEDVIKFYDCLSKALNSYLADKLNESQASIGGEIITRLGQKGLAGKHRAQLAELYQTFEMVLFSSVRFEQEKLKQDLVSTKEIINTLERIL
ncbi:MAG: BatD family protein [bacterium]